MINIKEAFSYPFKDDDWPLKVLIGTLFVFVPVVNFFSKGYAYTVFKAAINDEELYMPEWDDFKGYFIKGFWVFFIQFCYYLIPMFFIVFGIGLAGGGYYFYEQSNRDELIAVVLMGVFIFLIGLLLAFVAVLLYPMALANYAKGGERFGEAFRLFDIVSKIFSVLGDYLVAYLIMFCVVFFISLLTMLPFIGLIFSIANLFLVFYLYYLVWFGLVGRACSKAFAEYPGAVPVAAGR
jgi:hypothetical protein